MAGLASILQKLAPSKRRHAPNKLTPQNLTYVNVNNHSLNFFDHLYQFSFSPKRKNMFCKWYLEPNDRLWSLCHSTSPSTQTYFQRHRFSHCYGDIFPSGGHFFQFAYVQKKSALHYAQEFNSDYCYQKLVNYHVQTDHYFGCS